MHALDFVSTTPFGDLGFGLGLVTRIYIYNPNPFYFSKKIIYCKKSKIYV